MTAAQKDFDRTRFPSALPNSRRRRCMPFWGMRRWLSCAGAARIGCGGEGRAARLFVRRATALCFLCHGALGCGAVAWTSGFVICCGVCCVLRSRAARSVITTRRRSASSRTRHVQ